MRGAFLSGGSSRPPIVQRSPLRPWPQPEDYDKVLPFPKPTNPSFWFYRGQFCGIRIPDAPVVPGCNANNSDLVMTALLDRYPRWVQDAFILKYCQDGYTHIQRSIGHALANPNEGWAGVTLAQFNELSQRCKASGLWCDQWLMGGDALLTRDQDVAFWSAILEPIIASIIASGTLDWCCVGWQLDTFNKTGNTLIAIIAWIAQHIPQSVPLFTHWVNEALAWWTTGGETWTDQYGSINVQDRWTWWLAMQPYLTGGHHQGDTTMARLQPKLYQDKMKDTLDQFRNGSMGQSRRGRVAPFILTLFEDTAQDEFDGIITEDQGDLASRVLINCTSGVDGSGLGGYGNGNRENDGWSL